MCDCEAGTVEPARNQRVEYCASVVFPELSSKEKGNILRKFVLVWTGTPQRVTEETMYPPPQGLNLDIDAISGICGFVYPRISLTAG